MVSADSLIGKVITVLTRGEHPDLVRNRVRQEARRQCAAELSTLVRTRGYMPIGSNFAVVDGQEALDLAAEWSP